jgi:hypothetical protein
MSALLRSALIDIGFFPKVCGRPKPASSFSRTAEPGCRPGRSPRCFLRASNRRGSRAYTDFAPRRQSFLVVSAAAGSFAAVDCREMCEFSSSAAPIG